MLRMLTFSGRDLRLRFKSLHNLSKQTFSSVLLSFSLRFFLSFRCMVVEVRELEAVGLD